MSDRLNDFLNYLKIELTNGDIAAGISNGDIDVPNWISISENTDHIKLIDNESTESFFLGFEIIWYRD